LASSAFFIRSASNTNRWRKGREVGLRPENTKQLFPVFPPSLLHILSVSLSISDSVCLCVHISLFLSLLCLSHSSVPLCLFLSLSACVSLSIIISPPLALLLSSFRRCVHLSYLLLTSISLFFILPLSPTLFLICIALLIHLMTSSQRPLLLQNYLF